MKDSELEAIIKVALADDTEVPEELNDKLMRRISARKRRMYFPAAGIKYAAAAVVVAVGAGALINGGYFSDRKENNQNNIAVTNKNDTAENKNKNPYNSEKPTDVAKRKTAEADAEQKQNDTSSAARNKSGNAKTNNSGKSGEKSADKEKSSKKSTQKQGDAIYNIARTAKPMPSEKESDTKAAAEESSAADSGTGGYKYLEIAADGIGKALESLNIIANDYIDGHYTAYVAAAKGSADTVMFSAESGAAAANDSGGGSENITEKQIAPTADNAITMRSMNKQTDKVLEDYAAEMPEVKASYEVMSDTDNYYSVRVDAVADVGYTDEFSSHYTVDKNTESIVTLDDVFSEVPQYKEKLYDNILSQMKQRMKDDENVQYYIGADGFSGISGNEDFYMNDREEVVITYESGTVAPYGQGESVFNVGRTDELNNK